ncbi:ribonucleoprotein [Histoplasma capsulatum H143]|uniref:Ribonucleoprotein n=1 Tax=Ajellomyces capsulatus (strain H143) TaxID=544712 RepID=C6H9I6_AJECH|nr:ribonucleoprotein [Histoplasma capsulatum H143]
MTQATKPQDPEPKQKPTPSRRWVNSPNWRVKRLENPGPDTVNDGPTEPELDFNRGPMTHRGNHSQNRNWNNNNNRTHNHNNSINNGREGSKPSTPVKSPRRDHGNTDSPTMNSFSEGRRLYVGNMPYMAKKKDVEALFTKGETVYNVERVDISIDPFTGRNPSYCFVELESKAQADLAMAELNGKDMLGRPVTIKPGIPKSFKEPLFGRRDQTKMTPEKQPPRFAFERWERSDAASHWYDYSAQGRRLFVGGLPRMPDQPTADYEIRKLFYGFNVEAISKVISPHPSKRSQPGNHYYLFVDLASSNEAERAIDALSGVSAVWGSRVHIHKARGNSHKPAERDRWEEKRKKGDQREADGDGNGDGVAESAPKPTRSRWGPPAGFEDEAAVSATRIARAESPP